MSVCNERCLPHACFDSHFLVTDWVFFFWFNFLLCDLSVYIHCPFFYYLSFVYWFVGILFYTFRTIVICILYINIASIFFLSLAYILTLFMSKLFDEEAKRSDHRLWTWHCHIQSFSGLGHKETETLKQSYNWRNQHSKPCLKATDSVLTPSQTNMLAHVFPLAETL